MVLINSDYGYYERLQSEHALWVKRNFPNRRESHPLCGLTEELGEFHEAVLLGDRKAALDALADMTIYLVDYCSMKGWSLQDIAKTQRVTTIISMIAWVGRLHHSQLKLEQGIRGTPEQHEADGIHAARCLYWVMETQAMLLSVKLEHLVWEVWQGIVSKRDWKRDSVEGAAK